MFFKQSYAMRTFRCKFRASIQGTGAYYACAFDHFARLCAPKSGFSGWIRLKCFPVHPVSLRLSEMLQPTMHVTEHHNTSEVDENGFVTLIVFRGIIISDLYKGDLCAYHIHKALRLVYTR